MTILMMDILALSFSCNIMSLGDLFESGKTPGKMEYAYFYYTYFGLQLVKSGLQLVKS